MSTANEDFRLNFQYDKGRCDVPRAAAMLGFAEHDIPVLIRAHLLKPLGHPAPNAPKYFATVELIRLAHDVQFLERASRAVSENWRRRNSRRPQMQTASELP